VKKGIASLEEEISLSPTGQERKHGQKWKQLEIAEDKNWLDTTTTTAGRKTDEARHKECHTCCLAGWLAVDVCKIIPHTISAQSNGEDLIFLQLLLSLLDVYYCRTGTVSLPPLPSSLYSGPIG